MVDFKSYLDLKNYDIFIYDIDIYFESDAIFVITRSFLQRLKQLTKRKLNCLRYKNFTNILNKFKIKYIERDYLCLKRENVSLEKIRRDVLEPRDCNPTWLIVNKRDFVPLLRYYLPYRINSIDLLYPYSQYLNNSEKREKIVKRRIEVL